MSTSGGDNPESSPPVGRCGQAPRPSLPLDGHPSETLEGKRGNPSHHLLHMTATTTAPAQLGPSQDVLLGDLSLSLEIQAGLSQEKLDSMFEQHREHCLKALRRAVEAASPEAEVIVSAQTTVTENDQSFTLLSILSDHFRWTRGDAGSPDPGEIQKIGQMAAFVSRMHGIAQELGIDVDELENGSDEDEA